MKIDWTRKLASRKLWLAVIGFVTALMFALNAPAETVEKVTGVIMAGSILISYIIAEGYIDGKREEGDLYIEPGLGEPGEFDVDDEFDHLG